MSPSIMVVEKIRAAMGDATNYAVAKALGMQQSNLSEVLSGERGLGVEACVRASEILTVPLIEVLAEIEGPRARTPEKKAFWEKRRPRLLPTLAYWLTTVGVTYVTVSGLSIQEVVRHLIHYAQSLYIRTGLSREFHHGSVQIR